VFEIIFYSSQILFLSDFEIIFYSCQILSLCRRSLSAASIPLEELWQTDVAFYWPSAVRPDEFFKQSPKM
jgi:hypothetical protein